MRLWLSRRADGKYMLTLYKPILTRIGKIGEEDFYIKPGEPIGLMHMCAFGTHAIFGMTLEKLESKRVIVDGGISPDLTVSDDDSE